ncbi:MAG: phage GP46 family protein [Treponema sp.]|jgi:phage gp46-like protein|nr:phage GP46 family protein [Treponema sp.]
MSARIENWQDIKELVLMSIGTNKGSWWANPNFGSELWLLKQTGKVDGQTAGTLRRMILEATSWLVTDGLVQKIDCQTERTGKNQILYNVIIQQPNRENIFIKEVWNAL